MTVKNLILSMLMICCSISWAEQTKIKVSGPKANAILSAFRYTLTNFPDSGAIVKAVRCDRGGCTYDG
jgi:hypothetical protein